MLKIKFLVQKDFGLFVQKGRSAQVTIRIPWTFRPICFVFFPPTVSRTHWDLKTSRRNSWLKDTIFLPWYYQSWENTVLVPTLSSTPMLREILSSSSLIKSSRISMEVWSNVLLCAICNADFPFWFSNFATWRLILPKSNGTICSKQDWSRHAMCRIVSATEYP